MLPLSKQKLRNLIGDESNWAETPGTYKQLVNDRVFQFRDIRQYEQLIQLLIKVRTPKLSKESFRPSEVKKILNESLQVLTDEDLSAMVSTMERMDALEDTLRDFQTALRDAAIIRNEYSRYNQYILGQEGPGISASPQQCPAASQPAARRQRGPGTTGAGVSGPGPKAEGRGIPFSAGKSPICSLGRRRPGIPAQADGRGGRPHAASLRSSWQRRGTPAGEPPQHHRPLRGGFAPKRAPAFRSAGPAGVRYT